MGLRELVYPLDCENIITKKRSLKKQLKKAPGLKKLRVALLSGSTISLFADMLELFLLDRGFEPEFWEGRYGLFYEDVLFDDGSLKEFSPDIIYIHTSVRNIPAFPTPKGGEAEAAALCDALMARFTAVWQKIAAEHGCPIIQNNFDLPRLRPMGNAEASHPAGSIRYIARLNEAIYKYAEGSSGFYINDINYLSARYGLDAWSEPQFYYLYKYAINPGAAPLIGESIANIIKSIYGKNKKSAVLDLDNTLWGGVIGDEGVENIRLGIETPEGMAHAELQSYLKRLMGLGVMLNVSSKNEDDIARSGFNHPAAVLKEDDFIYFRANWREKHDNIAEIIKSLNIGADSVIFLDDNPAEREAVRSFLPDVAVPELDSPENFATILDRQGYFETTTLSGDDIGRNDMYRQNIARESAEASFADYGEYLKSLDMQARITPFLPAFRPRVTQLINKTNQFNFTTRRYTEAEIDTIADSGEYITLCASLKDKFGDNGITAALIAHLAGDTANIDLWVMSCRVFRRNLEHATLDELIRVCRAKGITRLTGRYVKTAKNGVIRSQYADFGFNLIEGDENNGLWEYIIPEDYINKNNEMEVLNDGN